jgi:DNA mismatch repair protein MutS2
VAELQRELDRAEAELRLTGGAAPQAAIAGLRERLERTVEQQPTLLAPAPAPRPKAVPSTPVADEDRGFRPGDRVAVLRTGQEGTVSTAQPGRNEIEVQIGPFKTRVKIADVRLVARAEDAAPEPGPSGSPVRIERSGAPAPSVEFDMRGWRVEEVIHELERYINDAYMANLPFVRIIHGKGTGALRQAVREELATNPLVSGFRPAEPREGGEGVTVAQLAL